MEVEHIEIADHLSRFEPFEDMPDQAVQHVASKVDAAYYKAESDILLSGQEIHQVYFIRSGAVEIFRSNGKLYNRQGEGTMFGHMSLMMNNRVRFPARAIEDTLVYIIPENLFVQLCDEHEAFADYVGHGEQSGLRQAVSRARRSNDLMRTRIHKLISRDMVTIHQTATVFDAASRMTEQGVSSLLITNDEKPNSGVVGIITDQDLRTRFIAAALPYETPVSSIMSRDLITVDAGQYIFDAMLIMLRYNLHHLPVNRSGRTVGLIALSDLIRYESQNSLFVVARILRAQNVQELSVLQGEIESSFVRMANENANSHMVGSAMTIFGRSFTLRLLELAQEELGPPPIPFCFMTLGSMARDELLPGGDQDNALILDDSFDAAIHDEYFRQMATFVSDGLAECGYPYCKGEVMATNEKWRCPKQVWVEYFDKWMDSPTRESLLHSSIFFDLDGVYGQVEWVEKLKEQIAAKARMSPAFLSAMARNALGRTPPLGFFKDFVLEQDGKHKNSLNIKQRGTAPLVSLVRVHALAVGSTAQNSFERLGDISYAKLLPSGQVEALRDAMEFMSMVRIRHQAGKIMQGTEVNNNINPEKLSPFERRNLKQAFQVVSNAQKFLKFKHPGGKGHKGMG